jgi:hypothetical protein
LNEQKTLVLLSSVMTWVNTPAKFTEEKAEGEEEPEGEEPEEEEPEEEGEKVDGDAPLDENGEPIVR